MEKLFTWRGFGVLAGAVAIGCFVDCSSGEPSGTSPVPSGKPGASAASAGDSESLALTASSAPASVALTVAENHPALRAALSGHSSSDIRMEGAQFVSSPRAGGDQDTGLILRMPQEHDEPIELSGDDTDRFRITLSPIGPRPSTGVMDGSRVVHADAFHATDVIRTASPGVFHQSFVLREGAPGAFGFTITLGTGLSRTTKHADGTVSFDDADGIPHLSVQKPYVVDALGKQQPAEVNLEDDSLVVRYSAKGMQLPAVLHVGVGVGYTPEALIFPQIKPRIMVLVDSSGSMTEIFTSNADTNGDGDANSLYTDNNVTNQNHYPGNANGGSVNSRLYAAKNALTNAVSASSELDFGLMRYAIDTGNCQHNNAYCCTIGQPCLCAGNYSNFNASGGANCGGGGPALITNTGACGTTAQGGLILATPGPGSAPTILSWVDNVEDFRPIVATPTIPRNPELRASGSTPLAGAVNTALNSWYTPIYTTSKGMPNCNTALATCDPELDCRPYVFIAMTDGADTCANDSVNDPPNDVATLYAKNAANPVLTYAIGLAITDATTQGVLNNMAAKGHTTSARFANSQSEIQAAFGDIAASAVKYEVCNGLDDNCNGAIDEGLGVYQECQTVADCAAGATCNGNRCACTTQAQCGTGFTCDANKFCAPSCDTSAKPLGGGACLKKGVKKCGVAAGGCCVDDGLAACTALAPGAPGTEICNGIDDNCNGQIDEGNVCNGCIPAAEICDGKDNDCDGIIDNNLSAASINQPCGLVLGICTQGTTACVRTDGKVVNNPTVPGQAGDVIACQGGVQPGAQACNGCDNNCDGTVDAPSQACYSGPAGTSGKGICHGGVQQCTAPAANCSTKTPQFGPCVGEQDPTVEVCDGLDNDCNGKIDDVTGPLGMAGQPCCPSGKCGTGICVSGLLQCSGGALQCIGGTGPSTEVCDMKDNDCDGTVDDLPGINGPCCPSGKCGIAGDPTDQCTAGTLVCTVSSPQPVCQNATGPSAEVCDGKDNDCNGKVDDLPGVGSTCCTSGKCGIGTCKAGTEACPPSGSALVCTGEVVPNPETCDGLDNDCDGLIDDVTGSGTSCCPFKDAMGNPLCGKGVCAGGIEKCSGNALACIGASGPSAEICDGLDNDCNGKIDDLPGLGTECCPFKDAMGKSLCVDMTDPGYKTDQCHTGTLQCVKGSAAATCVGATGPSAEICDGIDNDCNGKIDDLPGGMVGGSCCPSGKCGTGVCKAGTLACGPTGLVCGGAVNPSPEVCDGLDNDCNGKVDDLPGLGTQCCPAGSNCGVGVCKFGVLSCNAMNGGLECTGSTAASPEVCDGLDNDCNGQVDDVPGVGEPCCPPGSPPGMAPDACNKGICMPGAKACDMTTKMLACVGGVAPKPETCNSLDDDCNGMIDDNVLPANDPSIGMVCDVPTPPADQPPCHAGVTVCLGGKATCGGSSLVTPGKEICDGVDNDCNGKKDDGDLCGDGMSCVNATCVTACKGGEFPCPGGFSCVSGFCVSKSSGAGGTGGSTGAGGKSGASGSAGKGTGGTTSNGGATSAGGSTSTSAGGTSTTSVGGTSSNGGNGATTSTGGSNAAGGSSQQGQGGTSSVGGKNGTTGGNAAVGAGGSTSGPTDNGTDNPNARIGLATGGGGCACETGGRSNAPAGYLVGLAVALVAARRKSRRAQQNERSARVGGAK